MPCFARPNPELASHLLSIALLRKIAQSCSAPMPNSSTGMCLPLMLLRGAPHHYAFRQADPLDTKNLPYCQNLPPRGGCPYWPPGGRSRVHMHNTATRGHSGAYLPKMTTKGQSPAHLPILANRGRSEAYLNRVSSQAYRNWPPWAPWALNDNLCHRGLPEQFT